MVWVCRSLGSRPKVVLLAVCGDQKARGLANVNVELIPRQSDSSLYQFAVDDKPGMVLVMAVTAGKVIHHPRCHASSSP